MEWSSLVREARHRLFYRRVSDPPYPALPYLAPLVGKLRLVRTDRPLVAGAHPTGVVEFGAHLESFLEEYERLNALPKDVGMAFLLLHEVGHYFTLTWERTDLWKETHPEVQLSPEILHALSNLAFDLVINQVILSLGLPVRPGYLPEDLSLPRGLSAEEYLFLLVKRLPENFSSPGEGKKEGSEGEDEGEEGEGGGAGAEEEEETQAESEGLGGGEKKEEKGGGRKEAEEKDRNGECEEGSREGRASSGTREIPETQEEQEGMEEEGGEGGGFWRALASALGLPHRNPLVEAPLLPPPDSPIEEADPPSPEESPRSEPLGERGENLPPLLKEVRRRLEKLPPGSVPDLLRFLIVQAASGLPLPWNLLLRRRLRRLMGQVKREARGRKVYPHPHEGVHRAIRTYYSGKEEGVLRARRERRLPRIGIVWDTSGSTLVNLGLPDSVQGRFLREVKALLKEAREARVYLTHTEVSRASA